MKIKIRDRLWLISVAMLFWLTQVAILAFFWLIDKAITRLGPD